MPSLQIFNRRWGIASDDFVFPQVTEAILRFLWFVIALIIFSVHSDEWTQSKCPDADYVRMYVLGLLVLNSLLIVLCFCTAYISAKGTILNWYPRRHVHYLIYARFAIFVFEFIWNICGSVWVSDSPNLEGCEPYVLVGARITVALGWIMVFIFLLGIFIVFDPMGAVRHTNHSITRDRAKRVWTRRLRIMCICATADDNSKAALEDVADLLGDFFYDNDLVLSDVWAGLLLLANREMSVMNRHYLEVSNSIQQPPEWMNVQMASRIMKFAMAVYGWPYYVWNNCGFQPWCDILHKIRCCTGCRCDQVLVVKDNCCRSNTAAFLLTTDLRETDLFYVSFHDQIYQVPFVACADPISRSIILVIRGTMSLRDVVTDLCACDESLTLGDQSIVNSVSDSQPHTGSATAGSIGTACNYRLHRGMLNVARYVQSTLDNQNVLDDLFLLYPDYNLVVTGHSLGAGVAAIVSMLLRPKYPGVRCFAFSPPGCVVSEECVSVTEDFICSVVVGDDLVPRLSYQSMQRLKMNIVDVIENCEKPKYEILLKGCFKLLCGPSVTVGDAHTEDIEAPPPDPSSTSVESTCTNTIPSVGRANSTDHEPLLKQSPNYSHNYGTEEDVSNSYIYNTLSTPLEPNGMQDRRINLHVPGRIMHLTEMDQNHYTSSWCDFRKFSNAKLSSGMLTDHMPWRVADVLNGAAVSRENH